MATIYLDDLPTVGGDLYLSLRRTPHLPPTAVNVNNAIRKNDKCVLGSDTAGEEIIQINATRDKERVSGLPVRPPINAMTATDTPQRTLQLVRDLCKSCLGFGSIRIDRWIFHL